MSMDIDIGIKLDLHIYDVNMCVHVCTELWYKIISYSALWIKIFESQWTEQRSNQQSVKENISAKYLNYANIAVRIIVIKYKFAFALSLLGKL